MELSKEQIRETIARRVAQELEDGDVVTLGIGLPTEVANYVPEDVQVMFHSENGLIGVGKKPAPGQANPHITNAGGIPVDIVEGASAFDSVMSFTMIRGGHIDATVLGALQVDQEGNIANWMVPGVFVPGMGGAMDLVVGAKKVIVAMEHLSKNQVKIVKKCTLPLTAAHEVDLIITERCVLKVMPEGLVLQEINPLFSLEDITSTITADLIIPDDLLQEAV
ncbi:MAG: 3-oxoacid CoA-transferase subunit B [Alphaproteobacteria bacterium]|nr:3-oxoacid CoA-transferase subunit B [Alphaproteobacteria bacterium]